MSTYNINEIINSIHDMADAYIKAVNKFLDEGIVSYTDSLSREISNRFIYDDQDNSDLLNSSSIILNPSNKEDK